MINFKTKEDVLPSSLILFSLIAIVATVLFVVFVPAPSAEAVRRASSLTTNELLTQILDERQQADVARSAIGPRLWKGDANHVGADVLALVTASTQQNQVKLSAFRPQRTVDLGGVIELPYTIQLSGSYAGVRAVTENIDAKNSKVVLRSIQVNASEEVAGTVTSTLGISAYITDDPDIAANITTQGVSNAEVH